MSDRDIGVIERLRNAVIVIGTGMIMASIGTGIAFYYKSGMRLKFLEGEVIKKASIESVDLRFKGVEDKINMYHGE